MSLQRKSSRTRPWWRHHIPVRTTVVMISALVILSSIGMTDGRAAMTTPQLVVGKEVALPRLPDDFGAVSVTWDPINQNYVIVEVPYDGGADDLVRWRRFDPATERITAVRELRSSVFWGSDNLRLGLVSAWDGSGVVVFFSHLPGLRSMRIGADDTARWQRVSGKVWEVAATTMASGQALAAYDVPYDAYGLETLRYSGKERTWTTKVTASPWDTNPTVTSVGPHALLAWETPAGISAARVDAAAGVATPPTGIPVATGANQPALTSLGDGALAVWRRADGGLAARTLTDLGQSAGEEFAVVDSSSDPRRPGAITVEGVPVVAWFDGGTGGALRARTVSPAAGDVHELAAATSWPQRFSSPAMARGRAREFAVAYRAEDGVKLRLLQVNP